MMESKRKLYFEAFSADIDHKFDIDSGTITEYTGSEIDIFKDLTGLYIKP